MSDKLVSIVMPVYNSSRFIEDTLNSVLAQTYSNWELIAVDDCSTDDSYEILKKYADKDKRITVLRLEKNSGAAVARNRAIDVARGDYIAFIDSDDLWVPEKLSVQVNFMQKNNVYFSFSSYKKIRDSGELIKIVRAPFKVNYTKNLWFNRITTPSVMYNAVFFGKQYMPDIRARQDYGMWLKLLKKADAFGIETPLVMVIKRHNSLSSNKLKMIKYNWKLYREIENLPLPVSLWALIGDILSRLLFIK
ncbi:glycosyltransferase family 2 protein [Spirochaetia bacterium 38H-sp]|uniref:Glycosyltransferase family 2 protein n=1 Tax=Rarispira pelagica TaxID=3141764 RepID=A0ABU9U9X6_9SPIR